MKLSEAKDAAMDVAAKADQGDIDVLLAYSALTDLAKSVQAAADTLKDRAVDEAKKHGVEKGEVSLNIFSIKFVPSRATANFENVPQWVEAKKQVDKVAEMSKLAAKNGATVFDDEGVEVPPCSFTHSKESISVKVK